MTNASTTLPPEIWLQVIQWAQHYDSLHSFFKTDSETIKNLTVVSSAFRGLAQPELFRSLTISIIITHPQIIKTRLHGLLELLKNRPESAYWTKTITCNGRLNRPDQASLWPLTSSLILQLRALTLIRLSNVPVPLLTSPDVPSGIQDDPKLWLAQHNGRVRGDADAKFLPHIGPDTVTAEEGSGSNSASAGLASASTLRSLSLNGPGSLQVMLGVVHARPSFNFSHISTLSLSADLAVNPHFDFPQLFPNINHLSLLPQGPVTPSPPSYTSGLQKLHDFDGDPSTAALLVPGRPVEELTIFCSRGQDSLSREILSSFGSGSVKLLKLSIYSPTWRDGCLADVARSLSGLTYLALYQIGGDYMAWLEERLANELRGLPDLHTLCLTPAAFPNKAKEISQERQKKMLDGLDPSALSLRKVQLGHTVWRRDDRGDWAPANQRPVC